MTLYGIIVSIMIPSYAKLLLSLKPWSLTHVAVPGIRIKHYSVAYFARITAFEAL